jgi:hypothetical protein
MDFTRRRGPPASLHLGAAYQAKVLRGYKKFDTPQPLENCLLVDSACDQVVRQSSNDEMQRQRDSIESKRRSQSIASHAFYTLDETQIESSDDGSEHTVWSYEDTLGSESDSRSSYTFDTSCRGSVDEGDKHSKESSFSGRYSQALSKHFQGASTISDRSSDSPIKAPAMCRIEQAGVHKWADEKSPGHRRTKSI